MSSDSTAVASEGAEAVGSGGGEAGLKERKSAGTSKDLNPKLAEEEAGGDEAGKKPAREVTEAEDDDEEEELDTYGEYAPPLHLHTLKSPARLKGATQNKPSSRSSSRSRSRSTSPQPGAVAASDQSGATDTSPGTGPGGRPPLSTSSSASSLLSVEGGVDRHGRTHIITEDMLTDSLGLEEVEPPVAHNVGSPPAVTLQTVNERMSEESLEDVHAFSDLTLVRRNSGSNRSLNDGVGGGGSSCNNSVLETLDEEVGDGDGFPEDDDLGAAVAASIAEETDEDKTTELKASNTAAEGDTNKSDGGGKDGTGTPQRNKDQEEKIMFDMLDVVSTPKERQRLEEEKKKRGLCTTT